MIKTRTHKAMIAVEESFAAWLRDPKYIEAYGGRRIPYRGNARIGLSPRPWKPQHLKRLQPPWHPLTGRRNLRVGLEALQRRDLSVNEREEIYWAIHDYFAPE